MPNKRLSDFAAATYPLPNNAGLPGPTGPAGGGSYLPVNPPVDGSNNTLAVDNVGNTSWQPVGGYQITGFSLSGSGVAGVVEVGTSIANINWSATFNFTPTSISVSCTGKATQTPVPSGTSRSGTFAGPFTNVTNNTQVVVSITVVDPAGAPHVSNAIILFAAKVVWDSVNSPETVGQTLWNTLNAANNALAANGAVANLAFSSSSGQDQVFARLASLGTPTLKDSGGDVYPATLLGTSVITENGTPQTMNFYTVGVSGATFSWSLS